MQRSSRIAKGYETHAPDRLWVGDITFLAIASGFVYVAIVLVAWSRHVVGYAIGRRIDARLAVAAFERTIALRRPPPGCCMHTDSQKMAASFWAS